MVEAQIGSAFVDDVEKDFWVALEYRVCREFEGFEDRSLRSLGCDGLAILTGIKSIDDAKLDLSGRPEETSIPCGAICRDCPPSRPGTECAGC